MKIKGAIFDLDGTLLDSMHAWENVARDYILGRGMIPRPGLREAVRPLSLLQVAEYFRAEYNVPGELQEIMDGVNKVIEGFYFEKAVLKPGAMELLSSLERQGVRMCIATATDRYLVEAALKRNGILSYFSGIITCTETGCGKDRPEIFHKALKLLGTAKEETAVFEDAHYAVKTAREAGFWVVGVYDPSSEAFWEQIKSLANVYINSLSEWGNLK